MNVDHLEKLEDGWLDGEGKKQSDKAIATASLVNTPKVYPTPDGGVQIEWYVGNSYMIVEIANDGVITTDAFIDTLVP
jgi:hypothetical protein